MVSAQTDSLRPKLTIWSCPLNTDWGALQGQKVVAGGLAEALAAATSAAVGAAGHCGQASASQWHSQAGQAGCAAGFALGFTQPFAAQISNAATSVTLAWVASCTCCIAVRALLELATM